MENISIKVENINNLDTTGEPIKENDTVLLFNGNQDNKKWSLEKVVKDSNGDLSTVFYKYLGPIYTKIKDTPSNWLVLVKSEGDSKIFHTDDFARKVF